MFAAKVLVLVTAMVCAVNSAPNVDIADSLVVNPTPELPPPNPTDDEFNTIDYEEKEPTEIIPVSIPLKEIFTISEEKLQWTEARDACLKKGLRLASPATLDLNQKLIDYVIENDLIPADKFAGYWIGGHRNSQKTPWFWELAETKIKEYGWLPGEPNGYIGEDCVEFKNDRGILGWNNYYCNEPRRYICEGVHDKEEFDSTEKADNNESSFTVAAKNILKKLIAL